MFAKRLEKLVEKASFSKKPVGNVDGLKPDDVNPRLVYHYGVPTALQVSYDFIQKILAISTKDGRIKVFGKDGAQALLESPSIVPSKFLQFMENQGFLIKINTDNHIEVWDVDQKHLSHVHDFKRDITSFAIIQHTPYMYVGDSLGYVWVLKLEKEPCNVLKMKYHIPIAASHGNSNDVGDNAVVEILPQPTAESKRVLIVYQDGFIVLWDIQESKTIFSIGGTVLQSVTHEAKKATATCWVCPNGTKLAVGYNNGEIFIWSIPAASNLQSQQESIKESSFASPNAPICKLNIGYKLDRIPIAKLRWAYADGKASRLYVMGFYDNQMVNSSQVVLLNEHTESRTIKLGLHPPESCLDMEIISSSKSPSKHKYDAFLILGKSGVVYAYDDSLIERYLLQSQTKSPPSLPKEILVKLPFVDSSITVAKLITDNPHMLWSGNQDYSSLTKDICPLFPFERRQKDGNSVHPSEFSKAKNLYITGHSNGAINFWDVSCPLMLPIVSFTQQSEDNLSLSGVPVTALCFLFDLHILISGDQSGLIRIYKFKAEAFAPDNSFFSFQGSKKGSNHIIRSLKLLKVNGAVLSITMSPNSKSFSVGSDQGYVTVIDFESISVLYEKHIATELCTGIISSQFDTCSLQGFEKNVLVLATRDSSVLALDSETGNILSPSIVHPKKPSRALFMQILGAQEKSSVDPDKGNSDSSRLPLVLLCSEKAVYVYSLVHIVQGVKRVHYKKKFHSTSCCWASTFDAPQPGVVLLFSNGKVEIRSLPELSLLKETSVRGLTISTPKGNSNSDSSICSSRSGEIIVVDKDQEMFFISVSVLKDSYRFLELASQVYDGEILDEHGPISAPVIQKEKKKGIFGSVIKGNKAKNQSEQVAEDPQESIEELSAIFSVPNFPLEVENDDKLISTNEDDLDIDDIDIDDPVVKSKGNPVVAALNKQNVMSSFEAIRGKFKHMKVKNDKVQVTEAPPQDEKTGAVDQIKKRYGYASAEPSAAEAAKSKLSENLKKLQGINLRTNEMQETAKSFSAMAKEVLRFAGNDKANDKPTN